MDSRFKQSGAFSWCELMTTDVAAAKTFYGELLGWELEDMPMPDGNYTVIKAGGEAMAGMMAMPPPAQDQPPHWGVYVTVPDVDATVAQAQALGGKVLLPPTDIPKVGRFSVLQDPQGAVLSVITYTMECA